MKEQKMTEKSRLEFIVKYLNLGITNNDNFIIHHYVYLLVNENYISEEDADYLLEDIYNNGATYNYTSFLKEDE